MTTLTELRGRVVDTGGAPVPGARIVIAAGSTPFPEIALVSNAEGEFLLRLPEGRFTLHAHGPDGASGEAVVETAASAGVGLITLLVE